MADCCIIGCQWPTLATSPPKRQWQPAGDRLNALAAVRDTDDNDLARACRGPSGESAVAACRLFVRKNATICCQLITVPPRFFYPRPRGPYDGRGASTIRRGTRRIVEQMKMMQKVSHSINSYLILCFRIQRNQFLPFPASSQGNEVQRAWRR